MDLKNHSERAARLGEEQTAQALAFSRAAGKTFERLARQNYALMGDVVDYTLSQLRVPTTHTDPKTMLDQHGANVRTLAEKARTRVDEYKEIASEMQQLVLRPIAKPVHGADKSDTSDAKASKAPVARLAGKAVAKAEVEAQAQSKKIEKEADTKPASEAKPKVTTRRAAAKKVSDTAKEPAAKKASGTTRSPRATAATKKAASSGAATGRVAAKKAGTAGKASAKKRTPAKKQG